MKSEKRSSFYGETWIVFADLFAGLAILFVAIAIGVIPFIAGDAGSGPGDERRYEAVIEQRCSEEVALIEQLARHVMRQHDGEFELRDGPPTVTITRYATEVSMQSEAFDHGKIVLTTDGNEPQRMETARRLRTACSIISELAAVSRDTGSDATYLGFSVVVRGLASPEHCTTTKEDVIRDPGVGVIFERLRTVSAPEELETWAENELDRLKRSMHQNNIPIARARIGSIVETCKGILTSVQSDKLWGIDEEAAPAYPTTEDLFVCSDVAAAVRAAVGSDQRRVEVSFRPLVCKAPPA